MEWTPEKKKLITKWIIGIIASCIVIFLSLQNIHSLTRAFLWCVGAVMPLAIGIMVAMVLNVPMSFVERQLWPEKQTPFTKALRRPLAFLISAIFIIGIVVGIFWLIIPELVEALKVIYNGALVYINRLSAMTPEEIAELPFGKQLLNVDWDKLLDTAQGWVKQQGGNIINTTVGTITSFVGGLFNFFMALAFSIYILFDKENLKRQLRRLIHAWVPSAPGQWVIHASRVISGNFRNFVSGQTLEALILGVLCMLGMLILRIPYAPMVGTLVGVSALIPVVGAFAGAFIGAFMILTVDPFKALIFLIFLILLQWVEGNLIYPKVMGSHINLPGIWVLAAVTVGGSVAGPVGMLLGVPITAAAYCLLREATEKQEAKGRTAKKASAPSPLPPDDTASEASLPKAPPQPTEAPAPGKKSNKKSRNK